MTKLFISYSRKDLDPVERFVDQAAQSGLQTWIDYPAIRAGKLWRESIASAILECDFFLLFISSSSVQSESVKRELEFAVRNHKRIIPIRLDDSKIPKEFQRHLAGIQGIDARDDGWQKHLLVVLSSKTPIPPEGGDSNSKDYRGNKNFRLSLSYPRLLSRRFESLFLCHIYLPEYRSYVTKNIKSEFQEQEIEEHREKSAITIGQKVKIKLYSSEISFSDMVVKLIDSPLNKATFLGTPKDSCEPGYHKVLISIADAKTDETIDSLTMSVQVVDFAFDHVSRPLISRVSAIILGLGSFSMFVLTFLEQIDKTIGLTSGTAAGMLATAIYANFYSVYQRIRTNTP